MANDPQAINLSSGEARFTFPCTLTRKNGLSVAGATVKAGLSQSQTQIASGALFTPDTVLFPITTVAQYRALGGYIDPALGLQNNASLFQIQASFLIGFGASQTPWVAPAVGSYYVWVEVALGQEIITQMSHKLVIS